MGVTTLGEVDDNGVPGFREDLVFALENRNDSGLTDTRLNRWINQAYIHVCRPEVRRHRTMQFTHDITLVLDTSEYSLASTTNKLIGVRNVTYYAATAVANTVTRHKVKPRNVQKMDNMVKVPGIPTRYTTDGTLMTFNTRASSSEASNIVRVRYWGEPIVLAADDDVTVLDEYFDEVIAMGALWRAQWALGYREDALASGQLAQALLNEAADDMELQAEDEDFRMELKSESYMASSASR